MHQSSIWCMFSSVCSTTDIQIYMYSEMELSLLNTTDIQISMYSEMEPSL